MTDRVIHICLANFRRHARAQPSEGRRRFARLRRGHPRLGAKLAKLRAWMAGHRRAEATPSFGRLCPAMTVAIAATDVESVLGLRVDVRVRGAGEALRQNLQF